MHIPVINHLEERAHYKLDEAFKLFGFAYFETHTTWPKILNVAKEFFALPLEEKNNYKYTSIEENTGYQGMIESLTPGTPPDLKEAFNWCLENNKWPSEKVRSACKEWDIATDLIAKRVLTLIEKALDLPECYLIDKHRKSKSTTSRMLHYPAWSGNIVENQKRGGEHTDYGTITLLFTDDNPGLQIKPRGTDEWIDAPHIPNTCIVNVGDLLQRWTNDVYVSTPHRVVNEHLDRSRYSFAHFVHPQDDVEVNSLVGESKYDPISAKDYLVWRLNQSY